MKKSKVLVILLLAVAIYAAMCHTTVYAASEGATLYTSNCLSCHNSIPATDPRLLNATASSITNAIANVDAMKNTHLVHILSSTQIQTIADYINAKGQSSNWTVAGVGDFNKDGNKDIMWRDTKNGYNYVWLMNGTSVSSGLSLTTITDNTWFVAGVGDFSIHKAAHPDGYTDIFWRNVSTGENTLWKMQGDNVTRSVSLPDLSGRNWVVAGLGHFDNDTSISIDILWRDLLNGYNAVWLLKGTTITGVAQLPTYSDGSWVVAGVADFNLDGSVDILWRNKTSGYNAVWLLKGMEISSVQMLTQLADTSWSIAALGDFNADGYVDILWRNQDTGVNSIWLMNGTSVASTVALPTFGP